MEFSYAISFVLEAHLPFVREYSKDDDVNHSGEESRYFEYVCETLLPLLEIFNRLENDHVPFRMGLAISPILCHMLNDEHLQKKFLSFLDKQIEFGKQELERVSENSELRKLAQTYYDQAVDRKIAYTEKYEKNIIKAFDFYRRRGKIEIIGCCATNAFLPFLSHNPESLQAQMETSIPVYRRHFDSPQGFWLPCLGWTSAMEPFLKAYNYSYTIVDSHGLLFGSPMPDKGCFYPVKTPNGTLVIARDLHALREIEKISTGGSYRSNSRDAGYDLPLQEISRFLSIEGGRSSTGFKYWNRQNNVYNPQEAEDKAAICAKAFLEKTIVRLKEASNHMEEMPISLFTQSCDFFGRSWHEGMKFLETLFRTAANYDEIRFINPGEYIFKQNVATFNTVEPEFSSGCSGGYAETWLDVSNDWIYRHLYRAMERMTELAERFPDDSGLKERVLNQAAREILLAQSSDWSALLYMQDSTEFARDRAENSLRNFTTIYEALGSNYISTEWLTTLEKRHNIFPNVNYRVFRRKK